MITIERLPKNPANVLPDRERIRIDVNGNDLVLSETGAHEIERGLRKIFLQLHMERLVPILAAGAAKIPGVTEVWAHENGKLIDALGRGYDGEVALAVQGLILEAQRTLSPDRDMFIEGGLSTLPAVGQATREGWICVYRAP